MSDGGEIDESAPSAAPIASTGKRQKLNRWDRPKEPRDWRWVVGGIGKTLITIGLLMFAFVAYQLWGTGIQTAQAQSRLEETFASQIASAPTLTLTPTTTPPPTTPTTPPATVETMPGDTAGVTTPPPVTTTPPSAAAPTTTAPPAAIVAPPVGAVLAKLEIPSIGITDLYIVEGVTTKALADGPGHFPETPLPGQLGNSAIAGHRTTHGQPFFNIDQVAVGDQIIVTTLAGRYVYIVTGQRIVEANDYASVIPTVDPTVASITLASCHPRYTSKQRIIITGVLDPTQSGVVTQPSPPSNASAGVIPGDDTNSEPSIEPAMISVVVPPTDASSSATSVLVGATTTNAADTAATVSASDVTTTPTATTDPGVSPAGNQTGNQTGNQDDGSAVFGGGWFDDPAAWPQVVLWAVVLLALWAGIYLLSRRARRYWVGILVGFAPFVVALYFWFENVNRLLPPNL